MLFIEGKIFYQSFNHFVSEYIFNKLKLCLNFAVLVISVAILYTKILYSFSVLS